MCPVAGEDPFSKVKELTTDLFKDSIKKLQSEASSEADYKSNLDDELAKANDKKGDLETQVMTHSFQA